MSFGILHIGTAAKATHKPAAIRFGLANLLFAGNTWAKWQVGNTIYEAFVLPLHIGEIEITLRRRPDYEEIAERLRSLRAAEVSAEAVVSASCGMEDATKAVEDLCWLLSVARGTKVNWVYTDVFRQRRRADRNTSC